MVTKNQTRITLLLAMLSSLFGCMTAAQHQQALHSTQERAMTVGVVQKEIRMGMSQADVATALGSPNIVTRDSEGKEAWIYDKIATEASISASSGGTGLIVALVAGGYSAAAAASSTQRTLTVIIKFGTSNTVESFTYHASKF